MSSHLTTLFMCVRFVLSLILIGFIASLYILVKRSVVDSVIKEIAFYYPVFDSIKRLSKSIMLYIVGSDIR